MKLLLSLLASRSGATAIEYGLIAGLISIAVIGSMIAVGDNMTAMYEDWTTAVADATD
jgi:pilus assembly protein Flp/PilA